MKKEKWYSKPLSTRVLLVIALIGGSGIIGWICWVAGLAQFLKERKTLDAKQQWINWALVVGFFVVIGVYNSMRQN